MRASLDFLLGPVKLLHQGLWHIHTPTGAVRGLDLCLVLFGECNHVASGIDRVYLLIQRLPTTDAMVDAVTLVGHSTGTSRGITPPRASWHWKDSFS